MSTGETPLGKQLASPSLPSRSGLEVHTAMGEVKGQRRREKAIFSTLFAQCKGRRRKNLIPLFGREVDGGTDFAKHFVEERRGNATCAWGLKFLKDSFSKIRIKKSNEGFCLEVQKATI